MPGKMIIWTFNCLISATVK